jgi:hypothetical protein
MSFESTEDSPQVPRETEGVRALPLLAFQSDSGYIFNARDFSHD